MAWGSPKLLACQPVIYAKVYAKRERGREREVGEQRVREWRRGKKQSVSLRGMCLNGMCLISDKAVVTQPVAGISRALGFFFKFPFFCNSKQNKKKVA